MKKTINTIKKGDKFFSPQNIENYLEVFEVVRVDENPNGGKPLKDSWGYEVWSEPKYFVVAASSFDGKEHKFPLQNEKSDLAEWKTFFETEEEMRKAIYEYRKGAYLKQLRNSLIYLEQDFRNLPFYEDCMDDEMRKVLSLVEELKDDSGVELIV